MPHILQRYITIVSNINSTIAKYAKFAAAVLTVLLLCSIIARYFFNAPLRWGDEVAQFINGVFVLILGGWVLQKDQHVRIDILYERLSRRNQAILDLFASAFFFLFMISLLITAGERTWMSVLVHEANPSVWYPPIWPVKVFAYLAVILLFLQGIATFISKFYVVKGVGKDI